MRRVNRQGVAWSDGAVSLPQIEKNRWIVGNCKCMEYRSRAAPPFAFLDNDEKWISLANRSCWPAEVLSWHSCFNHSSVFNPKNSHKGGSRHVLWGFWQDIFFRIPHPPELKDSPIIRALTAVWENYSPIQFSVPHTLISTGHAFYRSISILNSIPVSFSLQKNSSSYESDSFVYQ